MLRSRICALGTALVICLTPAVQANQAKTYAGRNGMIAYAYPKLHLIDPNGTDKRLLTDRLAYIAAPAFSPDGRWIAFVASGRHHSPFVYAMRVDGTRFRRVTRTKLADYSPSWSPSGRKLTFVRSSPYRSQSSIYTVWRNGSHLRRLTGRKQSDDYPQWVDGNRIMFVRHPDRSGYQVRVLRVGQAGSRLVTSPTEYSANEYSLAPSGQWFSYEHQEFYTSGGGSHGGIAKMRLDGTGMHELASWSTHRGFHLTLSSLSPNADRIAYLRDEHGARVLWVMSSDGSHKRAIVRAELNSYSWSPDSRSIVYTARKNGSTGLFVVRIGNRAVQRIVKSVEPATGVTWQKHPR